MEVSANETINQILIELKEEYSKESGDLFIFLFSYFYPQFATQSDSGDFNYEKGKYALFGSFEPTYRKDRLEQLALLSEHYELKYLYHPSFFAYLDIYSMIIPPSCKDEELGGKHIPWYGEDSDKYFESVWTKQALLDEEFYRTVEKEGIAPFLLVKKIQEAIEKL